MSKGQKKSALEVIMDRLKAVEEAQKAVAAARTEFATDIVAVEAEVKTKQLDVDAKKKVYDEANVELTKLKQALGILQGRVVTEKKAGIGGGAVKGSFQEWIKTKGTFTLSDMIKEEVTPSRGYADILVSKAVSQGLIEEVPESRPKQYRVL